MHTLNPLTRLYGKGWHFPPAFTSDGISMADGAESVRQCMMALFRTQSGERIMREALGCDLHQFLFAGVTNELMAEIRTCIQDSIQRYESRAEVMDIQLSPSVSESGQLDILVQYRLSGSDIQQTLITQLNIRDGLGVI